MLSNNIYYTQENTMNKLIPMSLTCLLIGVSGLSLAEDKNQMHYKSQEGKINLPEPEKKNHREKMETRMRSMQAHMLMMHDYSNRILVEKNFKKKQALKDEQLELMKAHHMQMKAHRQKMKQMHKSMI